MHLSKRISVPCQEGNAAHVLLPFAEKSQITCVASPVFRSGNCSHAREAWKGAVGISCRDETALKISICSPFHCTESKPRSPVTVLGAGLSSPGPTPLPSSPRIPEDVRQQQGTGQAGSTILSLGSSQDNVARSSTESCNFRP